MTTAKNDKVEADTSPASIVDRYTVMPGDTLALIAAKQEIYGDARLWPLLYRANANQVGPDGLIFPKQVLAVNRNYTQDEVKALTGATRKPAAPAPQVSDKPAQKATIDTAPITEKPAAKASENPVQRLAPPAGLAPQGTLGTLGTMGAAGQTIKLSDYLRGAREAFAAGDSPWAIYYYSIYLQQKVTDIDVWGELGNVYYLDGKYTEAAKAYFNVANLLIDRGQTARALELMPVIEEGDAGLSAAIYQRLTTVKQ